MHSMPSRKDTPSRAAYPLRGRNIGTMRDGVWARAHRPDVPTPQGVRSRRNIETVRDDISYIEGVRNGVHLFVQPAPVHLASYIEGVRNGVHPELSFKPILEARNRRLNPTISPASRWVRVFARTVSHRRRSAPGYNSSRRPDRRSPTPVPGEIDTTQSAFRLN